MNDIPEVVRGLSLGGLPLNLGGTRGRARKAIAQSIHGRDILVLLSGPPKSGKSTILNAVIAMLAKEPIRFIRLSNPELTTWDQFDLAAALLGARCDGASEDIAASVIGRLGVTTEESQVVIAVDDAHTLSDGAMELLLLIASPVRGSTVSPQLILAGEGEFWNREWRAEWRVITSMADHIALVPLAGSDARDFVAFELARSGGFATEITNDGLATVVAGSKGLPGRMIEIIGASISIAHCRTTSVLDGEIVDAAIATIADAPDPTSGATSILVAEGAHGLELSRAPSATLSINEVRNGAASRNIFGDAAPTVRSGIPRHQSKPDGHEPAAPGPALLLNRAHGAVESGAAARSIRPDWTGELPDQNHGVKEAGYQQQETDFDTSVSSHTPIIQRAFADRSDKSGDSHDENLVSRRNEEKASVPASARTIDGGHDVARRSGRAKALSAALVPLVLVCAGLGAWANYGLPQVTNLIGRWRTSEHPSPAPEVSAEGATLPRDGVAAVDVVRDPRTARPEPAPTMLSGGDLTDQTPMIVAPPVPAPDSPQHTEANVVQEVKRAPTADEQPGSETTVADAAKQAGLAALNPVNEPVAEMDRPAPEIVAAEAPRGTEEVVTGIPPSSPRDVSRPFPTDQPSVPAAEAAVDVPISPKPGGAPVAPLQPALVPAGSAEPDAHPAPSRPLMASSMPDERSDTPPASSRPVTVPGVPPEPGGTDRSATVAAAPALNTPAEGPPAAVPSLVYARSSLPVAVVDSLLRRAEEKMAEGDILSARLLYERAAGAGSEAGTMGAGTTYDPDFLHTLNAHGLKGDVGHAVGWYRVAASVFGNRVAEQRLDTLTRLGAK